MTVYSFSRHKLDTTRQELVVDEAVVALQPKAFSVLVYLIENRDRMVPKTELLDTFWALEVSEAALQTTMSVVRKALGDGASACLKTYHGRGFRFVAPISEGNTVLGAQFMERRLLCVLNVRCHGSAGTMEVLRRAKAQVEDAQGQVLEGSDGGFSASFGLDRPLEDGAHLALICAHQIAKLSTDRVRFSVGVDSGQAEYHGGKGGRVWTHPAATDEHAAHLAGFAGPGDVVLSDACHALLRNQLQVERQGDGYRLLAPPDERAGIPAMTLNRPSAFVGREAEMGFLVSSLEKARGGPVQTVVLSGQAGIGKSRLVSEFLASIEEDGVRKSRYFCLPRQSETALSVMRSMSRDLLWDQRDEVQTDRIEAALFQILMGDATRPAAVLSDMSEHTRQKRSRALLERLVAGVCRDSVRVIVFEDVHWIDRASQRHLEALIQSLDIRNLLLILTTRPSDEMSLTEGALQLGPLGQVESLALLREVPELADAESDVLIALTERAAGNPFFLEELALATQSSSEPGRDVPRTVQAVIEVRIGALDDALRMVIYVMAVIGQPAAKTLIASMLGQSEDVVAGHLSQLVRMGFLQRAEAGHVFRHALLSDTAYAMISPDGRRHLHADIAAYFTSQGDMADVKPETLAWHFQEAGDTQNAIKQWSNACFAALGRSAQREAAVFADNGLSLLDPNAAENAGLEMRLLLPKAQALMALKGYGHAQVGEAFRRVNELSEAVGEPKIKARALVGLWVHTWVRADLDDALGYAGELLRMAEAVQDPGLLVQAHGGLGEVLTHKGELSRAMRHLDAGMALADAHPPQTITTQNAMVTCSAYAAWVSAMQGQRDRAGTYLRQCRDLSKCIENSFAEAIYYALCTEVYMFVGDVEACFDLAQSATELSREHGFPFWLGTGLVMQGWALGCRGESDLALARLNEGITVFEQTGAGIQLPNWYGLKAETLLRAGQFEQALEAGNFALSCAKDTGDAWFTPRIHAVMGHVKRALSDGEGAQRHDQALNEMRQAEGLADTFVTLSGLRLSGA